VGADNDVGSAEWSWLKVACEDDGSASPTHMPTQAPSVQPSIAPTANPTFLPTPFPSHAPIPLPTPFPSAVPSPSPSESPTYFPTSSPTPYPSATPQAGVTIVSPPLHWVSENGVNSSSFTIILTTIPLSRVWMDFSSEYSSLSFDPSGINFDYTNYSDVATVKVYAIDDDVDQGTWYDDFILTTVTSADSYYECDEALRDACGQATAYNGLAVTPMDVKIRDNDNAGVILSTTTADATYDNYGDALTDATYTVVLTSEPTDTVTVTLSGLGSYSSSSDTSVLFEPEDWDTPVTITVSCDAPTTDRPVCASGNRHCDALASRTETIVHSVSSSDSYYDSISVSSLSIDVDVVYDLTDPPHRGTIQQLIKCNRGDFQQRF
jgi:hypothetical protein